MWCSAFPHLYPRLVQLGDPGQLFSVVDVRILVLPKGDLQLFQLFVGEGGAVASPGGGGVGPFLPARADRWGGLTQGPLPRRFPYVCFQQGEKSGEAEAFIVEAGLPFPPFLSTKTKRPAIVQDNSTDDGVKKEGLHQLHGPHCHQAT